MKILLVDADSTIPNVALMKLSTHHKQLGDEVKLIRLEMPYNPRKKKIIHNLKTTEWDKVYCSVVFTGNKEYIFGDGDNIIFGGTGVDLVTNLPDEIENAEADYTIYPDNDISYGFLTRGCIRKCPFCVVPRKEGMIRQVAEVDQIVRHKQVKFLDNNILAFPDHYDILAELVLKQIRCQFNQGLDIRLVDEDNSELLAQMKYLGKYIFAFDNIKFEKIIERKLKLLEWRKDWWFRFYVYVSPEMPIADTVRRVEFLRERKILPFIMRDITCWDSEYSPFYIDLTGWANGARFFSIQSFEAYLEERAPKDRIAHSLKLYKDAL